VEGAHQSQTRRRSPWPKRAALIAGVVAVLGSAAATRRIAVRAIRVCRLGYRIATLTLFRRCPDCATLIHTEARVCRHCGFRLQAPLPERRRGRRRRRA
jgi:hypothetical protein